MIIAISGKANSGKDLVGRIIQYLTDNKNSNLPFKNWYGSNAYAAYTQSYSNWQIKKFADKLKEIVALLTGCTKEDLENEEFKNSELGKEWWFYTDNLTKNSVKIPYSNTDKWSLVRPTYRYLLQHIGTDLFRNQLHQDIWVNSLMSEYKPYNVKASEFSSKTDKIYPNWIITDLRFPNELKAIKERNGITIRVNRNLKRDKEHYSETVLDNAKFDYIIDNNGTIEELIEKVREILIKENVIKV